MSSSTSFWVLSPDDETRRLADWDDSVDLEGPIQCALNPDHQRAGRRVTDLAVVLPLPPVRDLVWTWNSECMVQEHVLELLRSEHVTGFTTKPVTARFEPPAASAPPRLFELIVTGWAGVAPESSGVKLEDHCPGCGLLTYSAFRDPSQLIERSQWDGSDLFIIWPLPKFIFMTDRIAQIIQSNELTGATLQRPNELSAVGRTISPGRLSYRMPEARAIELGAHLGIA